MPRLAVEAGRNCDPLATDPYPVVRCKLSIASNASYISLYCFAADAEGYVAERYVDRLPKASIGKACVQFKKLADLDEKAVVALIKETAKMGLVA